MSDGPQSLDLPQPATAAPAAGPPLRPLSGWATTGWALLALLAWLAAEAALLVAFLLRWFALNPGARLDLDKIAHDGRLLALAAIFATTAQCGVVILAIRRTGWPVAAYLGLDRKPGGREVVFCLASVALILLASDLLSWLIGPSCCRPSWSRSTRARATPGRSPSCWWPSPLPRRSARKSCSAVSCSAAGGLAPRRGRHDRAQLGIWAAIQMQYDWFGMVRFFRLGLLFGWVRWRSGSTALTMLMHAVTNVAATIETAVIIEWLS